MTSPASRLGGFLVLLVIMFAAAYAIGASLGPVTLTHAPSGPGGTMHMGSAGPARTQAHQRPASRP